MQLRLTVDREAEDRTVIHVDGRLAGSGVAQLVETCRGCEGLVLDLANLLTVDDAGIAALRRLAGDGIELLNASPYVVLLLEGNSASRGGTR